MYDPIMRVLTVLEILQAREHTSGAELARRLEVSPRTVQRYIARLQDLCVPVEATRGVGGFYRLRPGFRLPPMMFTDEEAFALALGLRALSHLGLSAFAPATEGAAAKLGRVLPEALRDSVKAIEEVVALEPGPWVISTSAELLIRVSTAIRMRRRLAFDYKSHSAQSSRRDLEPYGVVHMDGRWYMAGRCLLRQALRTFRLDRVSNLELSDDTFERRPRFRYKNSLASGDAVCPVYLRHRSVAADADRESALSFCSSPGCHAGRKRGHHHRCGRDNLKGFAAMLLSLGCRILLRQPQQLRDTFAALSAEACKASTLG